MHEFFTEPAIELRHSVGRDDSALRPRIRWLVGDGRPCHPPHPRHALRELAGDLGALRPTVAVDSKFIDDQRIDILARRDLIDQDF